jgi:putative flippase GtrA
MSFRTAGKEAKLALAFSAVALLGFATDASVLTALERLGMAPAYARAISLPAAMQVAFLANGLLVFRCLTWRNGLKSWAGYMVSSGLGNGCNYLAFVTLASLHSEFWSNRWLGLVLGGGLAWTINYLGARLIVFGPAMGAREAPCAEVERPLDLPKKRARRNRRKAAALRPAPPLNLNAGGSTC